MKMYGGIETLALKQHFGKKLMELEEEKRAVQVSFSSNILYSFSEILLFLFPFFFYLILRS